MKRTPKAFGVAPLILVAMRTSLLLFLLTVVGVVAAESDIVPTDPKRPLFQLYEMQLSPPRESDPHTPQMKLKKVLLTVFTLSDLRFSRGESGAQAILNRKDARIFSQLTHTHDYLVLLAGDEKASVVMHITAPIDDGVISFTGANYGTDVARYLRRRYGVIH